MKSNFLKLLTGLALVSAITLPSLANDTDVTITAEVEDIVSIVAERTSDNQIVSQDNLDGGSLSSNEVIDFGKVNALGVETSLSSTTHVVNRAVTGTNGTSGTLISKVIDTSNQLYDTNAASLPTTSNDGAIYMLEDALQLRVLRTGGGTSDITMSQLTGGDFTAIVAPSSQAFTSGTSLGSGLFIDNVSPPTAAPLTYGLTNNTAFPIDIGIKVPFTKAAGTGYSTKIIFTAV
ncbi:MAG: hypothetical protein U0354_17480 [Candidatus Sericytochromatia bacterium]